MYRETTESIQEELSNVVICYCGECFRGKYMTVIFLHYALQATSTIMISLVIFAL